MTLEAGRRFGPYEIKAPIGKGGMGEVYLAEDSRLGRKVAIKILPPAAMADSGRRARFFTEARAASGLNNPHIVTDGKYPYYSRRSIGSDLWLGRIE